MSRWNDQDLPEEEETRDKISTGTLECQDPYQKADYTYTNVTR